MEKKKPRLSQAPVKLDDGVEQSKRFPGRNPTPEELAYAKATLKRTEPKPHRKPSD